MAPSFDVAGWFAGTPETMARVGSVLLGFEIPEFKIKKLLIARDLFEAKDSGIALKYAAFIQQLSRLPVEIGEIELGKPDLSLWIETLRVIQWWELNQAHGAWISQNLDAFGKEIRGRLERISTVTQSDVAEKRLVRNQLISQIGRTVSPGMLVVLPTAPGIAPLKGRSIEEARACTPRYHAAYLRRQHCSAAANFDAAAGAKWMPARNFPDGRARSGWPVAGRS